MTSHEVGIGRTLSSPTFGLEQAATRLREAGIASNGASATAP